jgi:hypothetical protein
MPLSGWLMASTTPVRVPTFVFGLFELPYPLALDFATYRFARAIHVASGHLTRVLHRVTPRRYATSLASVARTDCQADVAGTPTEGFNQKMFYPGCQMAHSRDQCRQADPREMPQCYDVQSARPSGCSLYPRLRSSALIRVRDCHTPSAAVPGADAGGKMDLLAHNSF